jgi:hypothetical protein
MSADGDVVTGRARHIPLTRTSSSGITYANRAT